MNRYLMITALYRFICGGLILLINWELADPKSANDLAISTVLSFIPAIFTPFLISTIFKNMSGSKLTKYSFFMIFILVLIISMIYIDSKLLILCNFILWTIFLLLETSFEFWFSELVYKRDESFVNKYSSLSMTTNQVALMIGPLFITFLIKYIDLKVVFITYSIIYLLLFFGTKSLKTLNNNLESSNTKTESIKISHYIMSMLMWPILGTINFMLPIYTSYKKGEMYEVALLDSMLGIGMALIGILLSKYLSQKWAIAFLLISIILPITWYTFEHNLIIRLILMLLFGVAFGGSRIIFRKIVVMQYSSGTVKKVYSLGNALGLPILALSIYVSILDISFVWIPSFLLLIILLVLLNAQYKEQNSE
nr:hypothetical protein [Mammaliicoccus sp. Marseille-Q6498]